MFSEDLAKKIVKSTAEADPSELDFDIADVGLEQFLKEGFLDDLPIVGALTRLGKAALTVRDIIFFAKVAKFMFTPKTISGSEMDKFQLRISDDPDYAEKVGGTVILLLDRFGDLEKPMMFAKLFQSHIKDEIDFETFRRLTTALDIAFLDDVKELVSRKLNNRLLINLIPAGLSMFDVDREFQGAGNVTYYLTGLGEQMIHILST